MWLESYIYYFTKSNLRVRWQGWNDYDDDEISHKLEYVVFLCLVDELEE